MSISGNILSPNSIASFLSTSMSSFCSKNSVCGDVFVGFK